MSTRAQEPIIIPEDQIFEEEHVLRRSPVAYYPARIGEVLNSRYSIICKLGWGGVSTIWLAKDSRPASEAAKYVVVKICATNDISAMRERDLLLEIAKVNPKHPGITYIRLLLDSFEAKSSHGTHTCLVFPPLREPLNAFQKRLQDSCYPFQAIRIYLKTLFASLSYLHDECHIVHTDIKPENILLGFEDDFDWEKIEEEEKVAPPPRKILPDRTIYMSRPSFGQPESQVGLPKLTDFDLALSMSKHRRYSHRIQLDPYRAPEVTLGQEWWYPVDVWSAAVMSYELLENEPLCSGIDESGVYNPRYQIAQLVGLLGEPPKAFATAGEHHAEYFDGDGSLLPEIRSLVPQESLEDRITRLSGDSKREYLGFMRRALQWTPEDRPTAAQLLDDPLLIGISLD